MLRRYDMKIKNITTGKVIGFGKEFTVLPGETREVPAAYEKSPAIAQYEKMKFIQVIGKPTAGAKKPSKPKDEAQTGTETPKKTETQADTAGAKKPSK